MVHGPRKIGTSPPFPERKDVAQTTASRGQRDHRTVPVGFRGATSGSLLASLAVGCIGGSYFDLPEALLARPEFWFVGFRNSAVSRCFVLRFDGSPLVNEIVLSECFCWILT